MVFGFLHRGVAQPGSAPALGAGGRQFKSDRPDQLFSPLPSKSVAASCSGFQNFRSISAATSRHETIDNPENDSECYPLWVIEKPAERLAAFLLKPCPCQSATPFASLPILLSRSFFLDVVPKTKTPTNEVRPIPPIMDPPTC
jgi:hypothetical protein